MALYAKGNIWDKLHDNGYICITTNAVLDRMGCLVMGAGSALQAKQHFPSLPRIFGNQIRLLYNTTFLKDYWLLIADIGNPHLKIGALQTKRHWKDPSPLDLIETSIDYLRVQATASKVYGEQTWHCVMPGIGYGGLDFDTVQKFTDTCPDNVVFWYK